MTRPSLEELEKLVDLLGFGHVLSMLAEIATEKAEHVRMNWQDNSLADAWTRDARKVSRVSQSVEN